MTELAIFAVLLIALAVLFCAVTEIQRLDDENAELKAQLNRRWNR
jgi:hypothetical protein